MKQSEWDAAVDYLLRDVEGLGDAEAGERLGIDGSTIYRWRKSRADSESVGVPRGEPRRVLAATAKAMRSDVHSPAQPPADVEEYIGQIIDPDMLRRLAGTPSIVDVVATAKGAVARKPWPREVRNAADVYLNQFLPDGETST